MLMMPVCRMLQGHISFQHSQNTADMKTESSTALSFVLICAETSDIGTVMPVLAWSTFIQACGFQHRASYVAVSDSIMLLRDPPLRGSCLYSQLWLLFYFSLRKICLGGILSALMFLPPELFFHSEVY